MKVLGRRTVRITPWLIPVLLALVLLVSYFTKLMARPQYENPGPPVKAQPSGAAGPPMLGVAISSQSPAAALAFARLTGIPPGVIAYYVSFGSPLQSVDAFLRAGVLPLIQLDPSHASVAAIAAGQYDTYLTSIAAKLRDGGKPVALSFGHEMNGSWYSWDPPQTSPADFIAAWRHIHGVFQTTGARNVIWVWTVDDVNPQVISEWWPGDAYVTWVGIDGYYWTPRERFAQIEGPTIQSVRRLTRDPLILTEVAVYPNPQSAAQVQDLFRSAAGYHVKAVIWFNQDRERAWSLQGDPAALAAFRKAAHGWSRRGDRMAVGP
jgi:hypothetical protein